MRIYVSHSKDFDFADLLYKPLKESRLNVGNDFFLPHENDLTVDTEDRIKNSDMVLAEVSFASTRQGVELGWANLLKIPIVCIYKEGEYISDSLKFVTKYFIEYFDADDLVNKLTDFLGSRG